MYLLPHRALQSWISNYTITFPVPGMMSDQYTVIPHGCATLVFGCGKDGLSVRFFGPLTKPACVGYDANLSDMLFIVEFQPAGYYAFSGIPQKELKDLVLPFGDIHPTLCWQIAKLLETSDTIRDLISRVDSLFLTCFKNPGCRQEFLLASQMILNSRGALSVKELSQAVYYSERHINRIFDQYLGVAVKPFSRLVRVNHALRLLQRPSLSLQQVCLQTGFYDMPHFIHDFKSICGITPQEYRGNMSDFYSEIAKF